MERGGGELRKLPEVLLKWSDFLHSLEKLRHKTYSKNSTDRDWFRINPLELFLLGCQTLCTRISAEREYGTMILVMESIEVPMRLRPRYWKRLFHILIVTCRADVSPSILRRCVSTLVRLWKSLINISEFQPSICAWCIHEVSIVSFLESLIQNNKDILGPHQMIEVNLLMEDIKGSINKSDEFLNLWKLRKVEEDNFYTPFFLLVIETAFKAGSSEFIALELVFLEQYCSRIEVSVSEESVKKLLEILTALSTNLATCLNTLIGIFQLLNIRRMDQDKCTASPPVGEEYPCEGVPDGVTTADDLFAALATALTTWKSVHVGSSQDGEYHSSNCDIASQLLSLALVILASGQLKETLTITTEFFATTLSTLMVYSTEGYLSNSPCKFFHELIEYVSSLVEQGISPVMVVQTYLPNLFGPLFGAKNHSVSCKLLEYGYLAACSQHQKSLLSEGLAFLVDVYRLFPPIDKARIELTAKLKKLQALEIVNSLLEDIITGVSEMSMDGKQGTSQTMKTDEENVAKEIEEEMAFEITNEEKESENNRRLQILFHLLDLACAMIRNGDNVSFLFASILPKLLAGSFPTHLREHFSGHHPTHCKELFVCRSVVPWKVDKKQFVMRLLEFATLSIENDIASPYQICGVVAPKLVLNIDTLNISDDDKMVTITEILHIICESIQSCQNVTELVSHGIDLLTVLLPENTPPEDTSQFVVLMTKQLVVFTHSSLLFMLKRSCDFMMLHFSDEKLQIQELFKALIHRGKRDEIRAIFRLCRTEFECDRYAAVRQHLYSFSSGNLKHRQFIALCEVLVTMMDVEKTPTINVTAPVMESSMRDENRCGETLSAVVEKLLHPCLDRLVNCVTTARFRKEDWEAVADEVSKIALFRTLFKSELSTFSNLSEGEVFQLFQSTFPPDVLADENIMHLLAICGSRIECMQVPRFNSLKTLLCRVLQHFLTLDVSLAETETVGGYENPLTKKEVILKQRMTSLDDYVLHFFMRNSTDKTRLIECGYSSRLWNERLSLVVKTDGSHSLEENMRQTLLACYMEFSDILQQMAITHVSVDGELIRSNELFDERLTLTELKGQRAVVVRVIDAKLGKVNEGYFHEKKISLLAKEDQIEKEFAKQGEVPVKPKTFTVALNTSFFDCARCCGAQIIGCYAPNGEHCERPLEIGVRCDSAIASIYNEAGLEIENAEVLLTPEGMYLFKAYSNGHPYDTSQVWLRLFTALLAEPSSLVPAVIVPQSYPNQRTWENIRRNIQPEMTGGILTCELDFSPEWRTYYDHRPEKVRNGLDIVLHPGFTLSSECSRPGFRRQKSRMAKDLAGMIFDHVMQDMSNDEWWRQFRFLGKWISQYLSEGVDKGKLRDSMIESGLDYDRWKNTFLKLKNPPQVPFPCSFDILPDKRQVVTALAQYINRSLRDWNNQRLSDIARFCINNHKQFLEFKGLAEKCKGNLSFLKEKLPHIRQCLSECTFTVPLLSLPESFQEEIIHWIFRNEDRVWRYRGGRDGRETLHQFMRFLGRQNNAPTAEAENEAIDGRCVKVFAGVITFCLPYTLECDNVGSIYNDLQVSSMVGYAVGEMVLGSTEDLDHSEQEVTGCKPRSKKSCYEVVTAWIHPSYRGLNLGVQLYLYIAEQVPAQLVICDMLEGSVGRILQSNRFLMLLEKLRIISLIIQSRQQSYSILTPVHNLLCTTLSKEGVTEQFEQVVFLVWPVRTAIKVFKIATWMRGQRGAALLLVPPLTALGLFSLRGTFLNT